MEELRLPVVDRLVLAMVNRAQLAPSDLISDDNGGWRLTDGGRKEFLVAYQQAKQGPVRHSFLEQDTTWGMIPHWQARILARAVRADLDAYVPFEMPG
jgi:CRISPR-associated protein Cas1